MPEKPPYEEQPIVPPEIPKVEAVGIRVLGESDPRTMTREQFEQSPNLLFHGTPRPMHFSPEFDYHSQEYLTDNDGSTTLGFGFYAIDNQAEASNYSVVRQSRADGQPIVVSILPHEARVLDLRRKDELVKNAPIPRELALKWKDRFLRHLQTRTPREGNIGTIFDSLEQEYAQYLDRVLTLDEIDLRVLLGTAPSKQIKSLNLPSPPWTVLFSDFMLKEDFDGLVYNEGGEGIQGGGGTSYVFYNLKKIGTYESWHEDEII
ncbi:MAG: hypothetical protein V1695_01045 [Candidatus Uhrbacteria bacterium]